MKVDCIFSNKCKNFGKSCDSCRFNKCAELKSYLVFEDNGKEIRYLEG